MDLNQIKYFLNLAETLSFTDAARLSGVSQPSLTKSIQRLEDELGSLLVYRDGKDTRLTALGRELQVEFMRIAKLLNNVQELADLSITGKRRHLSIGVATTVSPSILSGFIKQVFTKLENVELTIHQMQPGETEQEVLSGKYNLCLLTNPPAPNLKLSVVPLFSERLLLGVSEDHPFAKQSSVTPAQMSQEPYLDRLHCEFRSQVIEHFMDRKVVMRPKVQSEREDWIQQLVAMGVGITTLPERSGYAAGLLLRSVDGLDLERTISLVAVSGSGTPKEVRDILEMSRTFDWSAPSQPQSH
ncbi:LysR family transcriptional regulator [Pelagimonas sp. KU-00592-HH]|uniref:LysR family transcriptional regulator n=1 Tax=Pelagimonas sp. KU-00592-HH TaxID=3127651 RepID=UPI0031075E1E